MEAPAGWQEFHSRFINTMSDFLVPKVRPKYAVYIERYVYVTEILGEKVRIRPDVAIAETGREEIIAQPQTVATAKTVLLPLPELEEVRHYFLEIRELETQKVVTVIEMLSPFNKQAGKGRDEYLSRRNEILLSDVHLVELDLLREGERLPMGKPLPSG
ncbi:MAG: DUF4058 family protein, partial [Armatimonadetes bacterium]|nr:DUF4058 family protein [Armatimonadota bacterium]